MKKTVEKFLTTSAFGRSARTDGIRERLYWAATHEESEILTRYDIPAGGLTADLAELSAEKYGKNVLTYKKKGTLFKRLFSAYVNPFTVILLVLAVVSVFTDIVFADTDSRNYVTVIVISVMVVISGTLRFVQETHSGNVSEKLKNMLHATALTERGGVKSEIPMEDLVVGDTVYLSAGDMVPADLRVIGAKDLFVSQSALTGESEVVEKLAAVAHKKDALADTENLVFMGSNVVSGSGKAVVVAVGNDTMLGAMAKSLNVKPQKTAFEKGVGSVSRVLIRFMLVMVPVVLLVNGFTKGDWWQAMLFSISVAVGLTPEMLPMIVTTSLARGAVAMSKHKVIVKNLNSIQDLGSMDILCTDKTGTLTLDRVVLEYHLNIDGETDPRVLRHAFLNSYFQTGLKNLIDIAVIEKQREAGADDLITRYNKVDEIPFDFERRRMSVVVQDNCGKTQLVTKGAVEEMLNCCSWVECDGRVQPLTDELRRFVLMRSDKLNDDGMRVIAVAHKTDPAPVGQFSVADESEMVLIGFLAFLDPPKKSTKAAIDALKNYGVGVKVLTGDNEKVTRSICRQVGLNADSVLLGSELDDMDDEELAARAESVTAIAKLSPEQKARVIRVLRGHGHSVGYMGDGINDAAAMRAADVGISVDSAVDITKETASVVLLEKDLTVLRQGVIEGRKTYANMIKYIKITASSNFGNMLSVLIASAFLPFLPMVSFQLILLNMIYDVSCTAMSWDNVDKDYIKKPRKWDASGIGRFMLRIGPTSSLFDVATYLLMYFVICPAAAGGQLFTHISDPVVRAQYIALFQTGWFVESMWSQTLVVHMLRTPELPFIRSRASLPVTVLSLAGICAVTAIPFTPLGKSLNMTDLPPVYFLYLAAFVTGYMALVTLAKKLYIRRYGELL